MKLDNEFYKNYFAKNNKEWIAGAYETGNYNYPVGKHRLRILKKILDGCDIKGKRVLDIGCGGGDITFLLASMGGNVQAIDMSETMLETCKQRLEAEHPELNGEISFSREDIKSLSNKITDEKYDLIVAFGLIGYLDSDEQFFEIIEGISKTNTRLILSCRNELFNMTSISDNTKREINSRNAIKLIDEIDALYNEPLSKEKCCEFMTRLKNALEHIEELGDLQIVEETVSKGNDGVGEIQPRQSTPKGITNTASAFGWINNGYHGVHPHLLLPRLNHKLPTQVFNILSDALCTFEDDDISLIWSSVFIAEFVKK